MADCSNVILITSYNNSSIVHTVWYIGSKGSSCHRERESWTENWAGQEKPDGCCCTADYGVMRGGRRDSDGAGAGAGAGCWWWRAVLCCGDTAGRSIDQRRLLHTEERRGEESIRGWRSWSCHSRYSLVGHCTPHPQQHRVNTQQFQIVKWSDGGCYQVIMLKDYVTQTGYLRHSINRSTT